MLNTHGTNPFLAIAQRFQPTRRPTPSPSVTPSTAPSSRPSSFPTESPSASPSTVEEGCGLFCTKGFANYQYVLESRSFLDAMNNPPAPNCILAPPGEVFDNWDGIKKLFTTISNPWIGGYKPYNQVVDLLTGTVKPSDPINGWTTFDGSVWPVNSGNIPDYWGTVGPNSEPNSGNSEGPQPFLGILTAGTFFDAPASFTTGALYLCCYDACSTVKFV